MDVGIIEDVIGFQQCLCPEDAVRHPGLDADEAGIVFRFHVVRRGGREPGKIVGVDDIAGGRIQKERDAFRRLILGPDQLAVIAGQHVFPGDSGIALRQAGIVEIGDVAELVGVDVVGGGDGLHGHDAAPLFEGFGAAQFVILLELAHFAVTGIADRIGA